MEIFIFLMILILIVIFTGCVTIVIRAIYFIGVGIDPIDAWKVDERREKSIEDVIVEGRDKEGEKGGWVGY